MRWPEFDAWVFSVKTFAGAMLALFIGFGIDLPRPYWAMATAYIVAQPLTGAMRSKGVFRVCGTLLGACASLVLVPNLANAPVLLCLAMALWTGACLFLALLDRTPRSYVFMLAGYTAAIIGFPSVTDPGAIFETAVARVEEISLGILCTTVVGGVVLPRPVGPVLSLRIRAWLADATRWSQQALAGRPADEAMRAARRKLASDMVEIDMLSTHLAYDISNQQRATRWVRALQARMAMLLPVLASIGDRLAALRHGGAALPPGLDTLLADLSAWMRAGPRAAAPALREAIARLEPTVDAAAGWRDDDAVEPPAAAARAGGHPPGLPRPLAAHRARRGCAAPPARLPGGDRGGPHAPSRSPDGAALRLRRRCRRAAGLRILDRLGLGGRGGGGADGRRRLLLLRGARRSGAGHPVLPVLCAGGDRGRRRLSVRRAADGA